jgi:uncharacterized membrane protein YtjA (UPF0391 family)
MVADRSMLHWALIFFVISLIAALLGFRQVAGLSAQFGRIFAVLAIVFLLIALLSGRGPVVVP